MNYIMAPLEPGDTDIMASVTSTVEVLVLDLLEWLSRRNRSYEETMDAWRTSCPTLPVWEEATDGGLLAVETFGGRSSVRVTSAGLELLEKYRPRRDL
jgi:hypothetical protein